MNQTILEQIEAMLRDRKRRLRRVSLLLCLALLVSMGTVFTMTAQGQTMNNKVRELDCAYTHFADEVLHVHNDDCYDENGALICPLSEKNPHTHSESCWEDRLELVCGLEENEEHLHDESCYELTRVLACGLEETHFHSDSCYDENGSLICGLRGAVWHSHTADCFTERVENGEASEETLRGLEGRDYPAQVFEAEAGGVRVTVRADAGALPMGTTMVVTPVAAETVLDAVAGAVEGQVRELQALDICFVDEAGEELEPLIPVRVSLGAPVVAEAAAEETEELVIVHVDDAGEASVVEQTPPPTFAELPAEDEVMFETGGFSVYVLVKTEQITKKVVTDDGETYTVTVSYTAEAGIPADAELNVAELKPGMADYDAYLEASEEALGWESGSAAYARLFDISLMKDGAELQPAEGSLLHVVIRLDDKAADAEPSVVHFGQETEVLAAETGEDTVSFETGGFSVYAIVDAPEPVQTPEPTTVADLTDLSEHAGEAILLSVKSPSAYFTSALNSNNAFVTSTDITAAAEWYFEPVAGQANRYRIYTLINGVPQYIKNTSGNLAGLVQSGGSEFELSEAGDGTFYAKLSGANKWLQYSKSGGGIRFWTDNKDAVNPKITLTLASSLTVPQDPYGLDGQTFGLAYHNDSAVSAAVMARSAGDTKLAAQSMLMQPDVLDNEGILLVAKNSDITDWTFESVEEDKYYITATVDGVKKYLTINGSSVTLEETPNATNSVIRAIPGTGENSGLWHFTVNGYSLNYTSSGFNAATGSGGTTWLNTVERSVLTDEDFKLYYAQKVSVSDEDKVFDQVVNGDEGPTREQSQVVVYTRVWNEETLRYEFYAVDHDGSLIRCYDAGDRIQWIGSRVNTAVWTFTEYRYEDGTPNYYYELQNAQYGNYIAPQLADGQVISDAPIGINLPGRRDGYNYTKLVAWDDVNYQYVGLKVENGRLVPCPLEEAEDFYFALSSVVDSDPAEELSTVTTVDNIDYGISMKMINFDNLPLKDGRDKVQTAFFGVTDNNQMGLLSTNLGADGYPMTTADKTGHAVSLAQLFNEMQDVNHLFLKSIHNESGYFEYDSTQNFAHLEDNGNFTVYDQIAAIGTASGPTRTHGQFMPYNGLVPGQFAAVTNQTDIMRNPLPDSDPRKGERLYLIPQDTANYFFGMELSASFTQTLSGLDDWGHDIIFEFSGDDDFWLYVDGELTLDLGGVHSASEGSVNFRTGVVTYKRYEGSSSNPKYTTYNTTLREIFKQNYLARGMSDAQAEAKLNELFVLSDEGNYVFSEFTRHTMKIYYMERGAGASNLHMRFNLASVKPGTVVLSKEVSGAASPTSAMAEFPYQVHYLMRTMENGEFLTDPSYIPAEGEEPHYLTTEHILVPGENGVTAYYAGTIRPADFRSEYTAPDGVTYHNVFMLKPGEKIEIKFPDNAMQYAVVECGVNPDVFDSVSVNGVSDGLEIGTVNPVSNVTDPETGATVPSYHDPETSVVDTESDYAPTSNRLDYGVPYMMVNERPRLAYDNHIDPDALRTLTLTKKLYDKDGSTVLHYPESADDVSETADDTAFSFRLYLGSENADPNALPLADMIRYHVKNAAGEYCTWNAAAQRFDSLGKSDYGTLTEAEKEAAAFTSSMNGSISKIPAGYSVEIRDLIVSTQYKVEERDYEIPKGYTLRLLDGYSRVDAGHEESTQDRPYSGTIRKGEDPSIEVRNQKGWGLTANKVWTDKDFMASHDAIYFAVYADGNLLPDTVRELKNGETSVYYFFEHLETGLLFADYLVREVTLSGSFTADAAGKVSGFDSVTPVEDTLTVGGQPTGGEYHPDYVYNVRYDVGDSTLHNENVREDTVTNSRPGIELYKTDWAGQPLSGAAFTLTDEDGANVAAASYTSGADGLITIAYLSAGTYTLTEITAPAGYVAMERPLTITVGDDHSVTVTGPDAALFTVSRENAAMDATLRIKNRANSFQVKKLDAENESPLSGVHFALYRQITRTDGALGRDYLPMAGCEDLVTDANGILREISMDLGAGTYYLSETQTKAGFGLLPEDICFTLGADGTVTVNTARYSSWLKTETVDGSTAYSLEILNGRQQVIRLRKTDALTERALKNASFALYRAADFDDATGLPTGEAVVAGSTDGEGLLELGALPLGEYRLVETAAPAGYNPLSSAIHLSITATGVSAVLGEQSMGMEYHTADGHWQLKVPNSSGYELPATGGSGTALYTWLGLALVALALLGLLLVRLHRRKIEN